MENTPRMQNPIWNWILHEWGIFHYLRSVRLVILILLVRYTDPKSVWPRGTNNATPALSWSASLVPIRQKPWVAPPNKKPCL